MKTAKGLWRVKGSQHHNAMLVCALVSFKCKPVAPRARTKAVLGLNAEGCWIKIASGGTEGQFQTFGN